MYVENTHTRCVPYFTIYKLSNSTTYEWVSFLGTFNGCSLFEILGFTYLNLSTSVMSYIYDTELDSFQFNQSSIAVPPLYNITYTLTSILVQPRNTYFDQGNSTATDPIKGEMRIIIVLHYIRLTISI